MQITTREVPSPAGPHVEPTARRRLAKRIFVGLVSLAALATITISVVSDDGTARPATPRPAIVGGGNPANSAVVPFSLDGSAVVDGTSSADG